MDAQQMVFTELLTRLRSTGQDVYDGALPPEGVPYPFIYMGDSEQSDRPTKQAIMGTVFQTVHVYMNNVHKRGTMSDLMALVKAVARQMEMDGPWLLAECSTQVLPDNTTDTPLLHGVINLGFRF